MRGLHWIGAIALILTLSNTAAAQDFDAQQFQPAAGANAAFSTEGARVPGHLQTEGGLLMNYSSRALTITELSSDDEEVQAPIVDQQLALHVMFGLGLFDILELAVDVPVYLVNEGDLPVEFSEAGVGDLRLRLKSKIWAEDEGFGLGAAVDLTAPTGKGEHYIGSPSATVAPRLIVDYDFGPAIVMFNAGVRSGTSAQFGNNVDLGSALTFGLGAEFELMRGLLLVTADVFGRTHLRDAFASEDTPFEGLLGAKVIASRGITITGAAGGGIGPGAGAPAFRMLLGVGWAPRNVDFDEDGIVNDDDECPDEAEDLDQFEDADGCPELDNDRDTVPDDVDECPLEPEDNDGFEDENGCPDDDNDGDKIDDDKDECRDEAEDLDGFEDGDGCPEPDNDGDTIGDEQDQCPMQPEDPDAFQDADGCPDPDNDNDKILDADDKCPNEAGLPEDDGCPPAETKAVLEGSRIRILDKVFFETNEATIKPESFPLLKQVALVLRTNDSVKLVEIGGHTDDRGRDAKNLELSQRRADAVRQWLVDFGIEADRMRAVGYGETKPLQEGRSKEARAANRRVEFNVLDPAPVQPPETGDATIESPTSTGQPETPKTEEP